jgi:hypothetical protein
MFSFLCEKFFIFKFSIVVVVEDLEWFSTPGGVDIVDFLLDSVFAENQIETDSALCDRMAVVFASELRDQIRLSSFEVSEHPDEKSLLDQEVFPFLFRFGCPFNRDSFPEFLQAVVDLDLHVWLDGVA